MDRPVRNFAYRAFISSREPRRVRRKFAGCLQASQRTKPHGSGRGRRRQRKGGLADKYAERHHSSGGPHQSSAREPVARVRLPVVENWGGTQNHERCQEDRGGRDVGSHARIAEISDGGTEIENLRKTRW